MTIFLKYLISTNFASAVSVGHDSFAAVTLFIKILLIYFIYIYICLLSISVPDFMYLTPDGKSQNP